MCVWKVSRRGRLTLKQTEKQTPLNEMRREREEGSQPPVDDDKGEGKSRLAS